MRRKTPLQRKRAIKAKPRRKHTPEEQAHLDAVAGLGCLVCRQEAEIHHVREGQGMGQRASHFHVLPLCPSHHRAEGGVGVGFHAAPTLWQEIHGTERELLRRVDVLLAQKRSAA